MNIFNIIIYLLNIKNNCKTCKHYIQSKDLKYEDTFSKCKLFLTNDNGVEFYIHTFIVRNNEKLCGYDGKYYTSKNISDNK
jgi:hypothetical protein